MNSFDRRRLLALAGAAAIPVALGGTAFAQQAPPAGGGAPAPGGAPAAARAPRPPYDPNGKIGEQIGVLKRLDPEFDLLAVDGTPVLRVANVEGNAEGPCWVPEQGGYLVYSDPPQNKMWKWTAKDGATIFSDPAGREGPDPDKIFREPGSNGIRYRKGALIYADSGNRAIMKMDLKTKQKTVLIDKFQGKKLNSTNDLVIAKDGTIFFTDPPYGLTGVAASKAIELPFQGIFRLGTDGVLTVVDGNWPAVNGIGLSPDEKTLYACGGQQKRAQYDVDGRMVTNKRPFGENEMGGDGMKVDSRGYLWVSGGSGLIIFNKAGKRIGVMETIHGCANCTFGANGDLYMAMGHSVGHAKVKARGIALI